MKFLSATMVSLLLFGAGYSGGAEAQKFRLPGNGDLVVGKASSVVAHHSDTVSDIALIYDQGFVEMRQANPGVDPWLPGQGTTIVIPSRYILPSTPAQGIVINVPEMRLYYYPKPKPDQPQFVVTHPISIGRQQWDTPHGVAKIVAKVKNPAWYPPQSIRDEHAENGDPLPKIVPPGPDNPLGDHAMRLSIPGYLIHGTNQPYGVGMRVTHGCIRMYPEDIARLYPEIKIGTQVQIVNQPFKIGLDAGAINLEVHPFLEEDAESFQDQYRHVVDLIIAATESRPAQINWNQLQVALTEKSGLPVVVGRLLAHSAAVDSVQVNGGSQ